MADTYNADAMPVAVFGNVGDVINLQSVLTQAYGAQVSQIASVYIAYYDQNYFTSADPDFSYWNPDSPAVTRVFNGSSDIGGNGAGTFNGMTVQNANLGNYSIHVGNNIMPNVYVQVTWNNTAGNRIVDELNLITVPDAFHTAAATDGTPTAAEVVSFAKQFASTYDGVVNANDCHWIAMAIAASAGATLDPNTQMGKMVGGAFHQAPELNEEGGFWRIAYRGSQADPVDNWESLLKRGDIVRMGWTAGGFHTYTVTGLDDGSHPGQVRVVDNTNTNVDGKSIISEHWVDYDGAQTDADSVTIYRLSADQRYLINGTAGNENILGTVFNDDLRAGGGSDTVSGGVGNDLYNLYDVSNGQYDSVVEAANQGIDTVYVRDVSSAVRSYTLTANVENGVIVGAEADQFTLNGNNLGNKLYDDFGDNFLNGGGGNDTLNGGGFYGGDVLNGGIGDDTYQLDFRRGDYDFVTEAANSGTDRVEVTAFHEDDEHYTDAYTLTLNIEIGELLGSLNFDLYGNTIANTLYGNPGANILSGLGGDDRLAAAAGDDTLIGGLGNDKYYLDDLIPGDGITLSHYDTTVEAVNGGIDTVYVLAIDDPQSFADGYTLADNIENGMITGSHDFGLDGNELGNALTGNSGANTLNGLGGNDFLSGGPGGDAFDGGPGSDAVSYAAATGGVTVVYGNNAFNGGEASGDTFVSIEAMIGSNFADVIGVRGSAITWLSGLGGDDKLSGADISSIILGGTGNDTITGFAGNDVMNGGPGGDAFNGGAGKNTVTYASATGGVTVVYGNNAFNGGDASGDTFVSIQSMIGSNFADVIGVRGSAITTLSGLGGNDALNGADISTFLSGGSGNDTLTGFGGNDNLNGGIGRDALNGGTGTDLARYDDASGNLVISLASPASNTGAAVGDTYNSIEGIVAGAGNDVITGNGLANYLYGLGGNDNLNGGLGGDVLNGGGGTDLARYDNASGNLVISLINPASNTGAAAGDTYTSIEGIVGGAGNDAITGDGVTNYLYGLAGNDNLNGGQGADLLRGDAGADRLTGGLAADSFVFLTKADSPVGASLHDTIVDFTHAQGDKINLSAIDADVSTPGTNDAFNYIGSAAFTTAHQLRFDAATHLLSGNVGGTLAADFEIYLPNVASLIGNLTPGSDIIL